MTPGQSGAAAGTNQLEVFVELAQGPPCTIPWGPEVVISAADGAAVDRSIESDARQILLEYVTRYYIGWSAKCGPTPTGDLTARVRFSQTLVLDLSIGDFRPACVDGEGQSVFMYADEPG